MHLQSCLEKIWVCRAGECWSLETLIDKKPEQPEENEPPPVPQHPPQFFPEHYLEHEGCGYPHDGKLIKNAAHSRSKLCMARGLLMKNLCHVHIK